MCAICAVANRLHQRAHQRQPDKLALLSTTDQLTQTIHFRNHSAVVESAIAPPLSSPNTPSAPIRSPLSKRFQPTQKGSIDQH